MIWTLEPEYFLHLCRFTHLGTWVDAWLSPQTPRLILARRAAPVSDSAPALPVRLGLRNARPHTSDSDKNTPHLNKTTPVLPTCLWLLDLKQTPRLACHGSGVRWHVNPGLALPVELWCVCRWICFRNIAAPATSSPRSLPPAAPPWKSRSCCCCRPPLRLPWLVISSYITLIYRRLSKQAVSS